MKKFVCSICGYVYEGDEPPAVCPVCGASADQFKEVGDEPSAEAKPAKADAAETGAEKKVWADEHRVGIARGLDAEVVDMLRANFTGECSEVGMYLAMSRQADREGYPEVAEAYKRIAYEEADHASKFAELLGEVVAADTKANLTVRVEAEYGATEGKLTLAKRAKELGYDAIHDTVHEMCKDEARHGKAFQGLLNRYFG